MNTKFIANGITTALAASPTPSIPGPPRRGSWTVAAENGPGIVEFTSFVGVTVTSSADAPTQPVELGGFLTANKVASPTEVRVTLAVQGDSVTFQQVLDTLAAFTREAKTVNVVTPEREFQAMTLLGYDYRREASEGLSMLTVELRLREICFIPPRYSEAIIPLDQARNPSDASTVTTGQKRLKYRPELVSYTI